MFKKRPSIIAIIKRYREALKKKGILAQEMILFGSHAHGKPREDSDIDLLVISKDFFPMDLRQRMEVLGVASVQIMEPIEALGYTPDEIKNISPANFLAQVVATGIKIS